MAKPAGRVFILAFFSTVMVLTGIVTLFVVLVDPYGVWGTPVVMGWTNFKAGQDDKTDYFFKVYEVIRRNPEVVIIGNSRAASGFYPTWPGFDDGKVYNLGVSGAHATEMMENVDLVAARCNVKKVVIGLDFGVCAKPHFRPQWPARMMEWSKRSRFLNTLYKMKETVLCHDALREAFNTLHLSRKHPTEVCYVRGFKLIRNYYDGRFSKALAPRTHYTDSELNGWNLLLASNKGSFDYRIDDEGTKVLNIIRNTVAKARARGVEVLFVLLPSPAAQLILMDQNDGAWAEVERWKEALAHIAEVWDFSGINEVTTSYSPVYWYESVHFTPKVGEMMVRRITRADRTSGFGSLLTPNNAGSVFAANRSLFLQWVREDRFTHNLMLAVNTAQPDAGTTFREFLRKQPQ